MELDRSRTLEGIRRVRTQPALRNSSRLDAKLRDWRKRRRSTDDLQRWLATADAADSDGDLSQSLVLAVVKRIEDLLDFAVEAEGCDTRDATWLRDHGDNIYLARFNRLPRQETLKAYDEWLDAHEGAKDLWNPKHLEDDLERSLESARSWNHTIPCFLRDHPGAAR